MAKARRPKPPGKPARAKKPASTKTKAAADKTSAAKAAQTKGQATAERVPTPYDPEYERPISELPPLTFPNSEEHEFRIAAAQKRRSRIRNESIFGALLVVGALIVLIAGHTPAFLALAAIAAAAMAAYELIISGLE